MSRIQMNLRRVLLGLAVTGSLGFGATQAIATTPSQAAPVACPDLGTDYYYSPCVIACGGRQAYCADGGICRCGLMP